MPQRRWVQEHTDALVALFEDDEFDPSKVSTGYLNDKYDALDDSHVLKTVTKERFRHHYKEKCRQFLVGQSLNGAPSECFMCIKQFQLRPLTLMSLFI